MIEAAAIASLTSAVTLLGTDYLKGVAGEASKATWNQIKSLFGWTSDPNPEELPERVAAEVTKSPETAEQLLRILQQSASPTARQLVHNIIANGGKVVVAQTITTNTFQM